MPLYIVLMQPLKIEVTLFNKQWLHVIIHVSTNISTHTRTHTHKSYGCIRTESITKLYVGLGRWMFPFLFSWCWLFFFFWGGGVGCLGFRVGVLARY